MMRRKLTKLEQVALGWMALDYENVETIFDNVAEDIGQEVTQADIFMSLIQLHKKKLVVAYLDDEEAQRFMVTSTPEKHEMKTVWWLDMEMAQNK